MNDRAIRLGNDDALVIAAPLLAAAVGRCLLLMLAGRSMEQVERWLKWNDHSKGLAVLKVVCGILVMLGGVWLIYSAP